MTETNSREPWWVKAAGYALGIAGLLLILGVAVLIAYLVYGDPRCVIAECRIIR